MKTLKFLGRECVCFALVGIMSCFFVAAWVFSTFGAVVSWLGFQFMRPIFTIKNIIERIGDD